MEIGGNIRIFLQNRKSSLNCTALPGGSHANAAHLHPLIQLSSHLDGLASEASLMALSSSLSLAWLPYLNIHNCLFVSYPCLVCPSSRNGSSTRAGHTPPHHTPQHSAWGPAQRKCSGYLLRCTCSLRHLPR